MNLLSRLSRLLGSDRPTEASAAAETGRAAMSVDALIRQGDAAEARGDCDEAERLYRAATATDPASADAHLNLGNALNAKGQMPAAIASYERAIELDPEHAAAHCNLGLVLLDTGDDARVERHFRAALRAREAFPQAWVGLALVSEAQGNVDAAVQGYRRAIRHKPDYVEAYCNLAALHRQQGQMQSAVETYSKALLVKPDHAEAHYRLGLLYKEHGQLGAAIECYRKALALTPNRAELLGDLGNALQDQGEHDAAIAHYRQALALNPGHIGGHGNLLFTLNYHPDLSGEEIFAEYQSFDERFGAPLRTTWRDHANDRNAARRLRVGYVSPDFRQHPVSLFLEPLLAQHDKSVVEVFAYAELATQDAVTERYRGYADHWILTHGLSDEALAERIRADGIDVLVDLAGHTANNRLGVFARKPTPVSLSWLGFGYTTGITAIDYLLTDEASAPQGSQHLFAERLWRLATPCYAYRPAEGMGDVGASPAKTRGHVTFGTLTRSVRINHRTIRVWAEILGRVDGARLVVDSRNFVDASMRAALVGGFAAHGIASNRLEIGFHTPPWDVLRGIDIGLDCFPHNSGTTLFESLYMGVPYVTLAGRPSVGRLGSSILQGVGHPEWIAQTEDQYIQIAVALARDGDRLAATRDRLRAEIARSPLMDEPGLARKVEAAYREMFANWAAARS